jgi:hypothetical protein
MKPHEPKNKDKTRTKKEEMKGVKKTKPKKREKSNKTLGQNYNNVR